MKSLKSSKQVIKFSALFLLAATAHYAIAQESELSSLRKEHRAELADLRIEQVRSENPELAAEMEAFRAEQQAQHEVRDAEFREKYPLLAEQRDERQVRRDQRFEDGERRGQGRFGGMRGGNEGGRGRQ